MMSMVDARHISQPASCTLSRWRSRVTGRAAAICRQLAVFVQTSR